MRLLSLLLLALPIAAQPPPREPAEAGIPVTSTLVKNKCESCHKSDDKGNMTRISWERTTPEGWQEIVKRMVRLNHAQLTPEEARDIVKTLSDTHGLAPEEAKRVAWYVEKRHVENETIPSDTLRDTCSSCHPLAQAMSWRRSREEWDLLIEMHKGYFPVVEFTSFRRPDPPPGQAPAAAPAPAPPADASRPAATPAEASALAAEEMAKINPLHSPEWASWQAARREPKLAGRWMVSAYRASKGRFIGEMVVEAGPADSFTTRTTLTSLKTGEKVIRTGKGVVFTGYAWRGRSTSGKTEEREVMSFSRDQQSAEGRWFWGGYNEFGYDVTLRRAGDGPVLLTTDANSLQAGSQGAVLKIYGDMLPAGLMPADVDLGGGVTVTQIVSQTRSLVTVKVDVAAAAVTGPRDLSIKRHALPGAIAVYNKVDYIRTPGSAIARLGGNTHPKGYFQFEAVAYSNGLDGKPNTSDDVPLGPVDATWSLEEFVSHYGDDDIEFVGSLTAEGLFTPNIEGPNERRKFGANNYGDVWVVARHQPPGTEKPLIAKSYLVVAVPLYIRWDAEAGR
jgi:quinohemoprotein amine dehydrogenase